MVATDLTASGVARLRKRAGSDPEKALDVLLESVLDEAKNLSDADDLSRIALGVLSSLVDRLAIRIVIERDWTRPTVEMGGVVIPDPFAFARSEESMRMSSNYQQ